MRKVEQPLAGNYCRTKWEELTVKKGRSIVNPAKEVISNKHLSRTVWSTFIVGKTVIGLSAAVLLSCGFPVLAQTQQAPNPQTAAADGQPSQPSVGTISGSVVDRTGAVVPGAHVKLSREGQSIGSEAETDSEGQFSFAGIAPGPFELTITSQGFATQTSPGTLHSGEDYVVQPIALDVAAAASEVRVAMTPMEIAEAEIKDEEKQRVLGVIPNFYVTYNPAAVPLHPKQKFELAWKALVDPVTFGITGAVAGVQQSANAFSGYGQGAQGYGKRFGAAYADSVSGTFIGSAILPSLFKQDPRYFYKGVGTRRSRFFYAVANAFICKGDNGHWQPAYSALLGSLAAGGISNLYYPATDRDLTVTFENFLVGIGSTAANNVLQEFIIRKLTRNAPKYASAQP